MAGDETLELDEDDAETHALLGRLREAFPLRDVIYWVLPVSGSGRLAP